MDHALDLQSMITAQTPMGNPLHSAVKAFANMPRICQLIKLGVSVTQKNGMGHTPAVSARIFDQPTIADVIERAAQDAANAQGGHN